MFITLCYFVSTFPACDHLSWTLIAMCKAKANTDRICLNNVILADAKPVACSDCISIFTVRIYSSLPPAEDPWLNRPLGEAKEVQEAAESFRELPSASLASGLNGRPQAL